MKKKIYAVLIAIASIFGGGRINPASASPKLPRGLNNHLNKCVRMIRNGAHLGVSLDDVSNNWLATANNYEEAVSSTYKQALVEAESNVKATEDEINRLGLDKLYAKSIYEETKKLADETVKLENERISFTEQLVRAEQELQKSMTGLKVISSRFRFLPSKKSVMDKKVMSLIISLVIGGVEVPVLIDAMSGVFDLDGIMLGVIATGYASFIALCCEMTGYHYAHENKKSMIATLATSFMLLSTLFWFRHDTGTPLFDSLNAFSFSILAVGMIAGMYMAKRRLFWKIKDHYTEKQDNVSHLKAEISKCEAQKTALVSNLSNEAKMAALNKYTQLHDRLAAQQREVSKLKGKLTSIAEQYSNYKTYGLTQIKINYAEVNNI